MRNVIYYNHQEAVDRKGVMKCERQKKATAYDGLDSGNILHCQCGCRNCDSPEVRARQGGKPLASIINYNFEEVKR